MNDKEFDDILKLKLGEHQVTMSGDEWELMHNALNEASDFDQLFKEKLQEYPIAYEPASWDSLASKLDHLSDANIDENEFDQTLANKLSNSTVAYKESHWQILKEKLEFQKERKQKIVITKITEVAILALLLFSFLTIQPFERFSKPHKSTIASIHQESNTLETLNQISAEGANVDATVNILVHNENGNQGELNQNEYKTNLLSHSLENLQETPVQNNFSNSNQADQFSSDNVINKKQIQATETAVDETFDNQTQQHNSTPQKQFPSIQEIIKISPIIRPTVFNEVKQQYNSHQASPAVVTNSTVVQDNPRSADIGFSETESIQFASLGKLEGGIESNRESKLLSDPNLAPWIIVNKSKKKGQSWIGIIASLDYNIIDRPLNFKLFLAPEKFGAYGTSFGVQYARTKGHNEFVMGMVRSVKSYDPKQNEVFNVNSSLYNRDFVRQAFDLLQIPIHYKRHFGKLDKTHLYAFAGLDMNFIMLTKFTFENKLLDGEIREDEVISKKSRFDDTVLNKGLFQGGDINKNLFLTADIGFGVERRINNQSFFMETHFKKNVFASQLGPNKENLNSLSFNIGSRIKI